MATGTVGDKPKRPKTTTKINSAEAIAETEKTKTPKAAKAAKEK